MQAVKQSFLILLKFTFETLHKWCQEEVKYIIEERNEE